MCSPVLKDRYAGEAAWTEWFEICSVAGCSAGHAAKLRAEVEGAMTQCSLLGVAAPFDSNRELQWDVAKSGPCMVQNCMVQYCTMRC